MFENLSVCAPSEAEYHIFVVYGTEGETEYSDIYVDEYYDQSDIELDEGFSLIEFIITPVMNSDKRNYAIDMTESAIKTLLWMSTDDNGSPIDCDESDLSEESHELIYSACRSFVQQYWTEIQEDGLDSDIAGHMFIGSATGSGFGFWDSSLKHGDAFHNDARPYHLEAYVDNGRVYVI